MEITEVRIFPRESEDRKLKAYATITIDNAFVVRNVKVIEGNKGLFVAMPSRKLREACPKCGFKNAMRSKFCNQCGSSLPQNERRVESTEHGPRQSGHRDIAHPITPECREYIQNKVLQAYSEEIKSGASFASRPKEKSEDKKERSEDKKERSEDKKERSEAKIDVPGPSQKEASGGTSDSFEGDLEL